MFADQMLKVVTGLAIIIPVILVLRWWLTRSGGTPEQWAEERVVELKGRLARGEIDEATYRRLLQDLSDD